MAYRVGDVLNGVSVEQLEPGTIFKIIEGRLGHINKLCIRAFHWDNNKEEISPIVIFLNNGDYWTNMSYIPEIEIIKLPN